MPVESVPHTTTLRVDQSIQTVIMPRRMIPGSRIQLEDERAPLPPPKTTYFERSIQGTPVPPLDRSGHSRHETPEVIELRKVRTERNLGNKPNIHK